MFWFIFPVNSGFSNLINVRGCHWDWREGGMLSGWWPRLSVQPPNLASIEIFSIWISCSNQPENQAERLNCADNKEGKWVSGKFPPVDWLDLITITCVCSILWFTVDLLRKILFLKIRIMLDVGLWSIKRCTQPIKLLQELAPWTPF